jgi:hypothetical protein
VANNFDPRRLFFRSASRFLEPDDARETPDSDLPRLTPKALEKLPIMSRSRERILSNLDEMYREAFERAQTSADESQMATLDFAYRREQLYFEILLDIRDAMERR